MKRFFDYPEGVWKYFQEVDSRLGGGVFPQLQPADIDAGLNSELKDVRAVLWDVYGTMCGVELGDLQKTLEYEDRIQQAAMATIVEFSLEAALQSMKPGQSPNVVLRERYLRLIDESHRRSQEAGIDCPEVLIEHVWQTILQDCVSLGYQPMWEEPPLHTAYRWGYFFDASLQRTCLYPGINEALVALRQAGLVQGIISNAQFYTPLHLRRLLRTAQGRDELELDEIFVDPLILFSYELGYSKPNLGAFQQAIDILGQQSIVAEEIVYVGNDMLNDVWAAASSGMKTILFAGDGEQTVLRADDERCQSVRPDAVVTEAGQIAELIINQ